MREWIGQGREEGQMSGWLDRRVERDEGCRRVRKGRVILLGRLRSRGRVGGIDKRQYLDQSKSLVTVNCLCFSQVMLPCPRKPNSLFLYFFFFIFVYRISLHLCTSVCVCVYTYNVLYNIILLLFPLFFFSFLFVFSLSLYHALILFFSLNYNFARRKPEFFSFYYQNIIMSQKPTQL